MVDIKTVEYILCSNGAVEGVTRDIFAALRAILAERKLGPLDWPSIIHSIERVLHEAPLPRLGIITDVCSLETHLK